MFFAFLCFLLEILLFKIAAGIVPLKCSDPQSTAEAHTGDLIWTKGNRVVQELTAAIRDILHKHSNKYESTSATLV